MRWKDHGNYGSRDNAIAALQRRADLPTQEAERLLGLLSLAHEVAVKAVPSHVQQRRSKVNPFASAKDIDHAACLQVMQEAVPELPSAVHEHLLGWVVYWHWMR